MQQQFYIFKWYDISCIKWHHVVHYLYIKELMFLTDIYDYFQTDL